MSGQDRVRKMWAAQERLLSLDVREHIHPYSAFYRPRLERAGIGPGTSGAEILRRLPPTGREEVDDFRRLVLAPPDDVKRLRRHGLHRAPTADSYKPVHWHLDHDVPIAYAAADVERLGELGRRLLSLAGVGRHDNLVSVLPAGPHLAYWQLVLGCRRAALSALHLSQAPSPAELATADPTVLAGEPDDLRRLLGAKPAGTFDRVHTVLAVGAPLEAHTRDEIGAMLPRTDAVVVSAWAPVGARAVWGECRGGHGYHAWDDTELVEALDPVTGERAAPGLDGELVWTGLGWKGTALLRWRTGAWARVVAGACPDCGRMGTLVGPTPERQPLATVLERVEGVADWQAEARTVDGADELIVYLAVNGSDHPGRLLRALDRQLSVTQFVVLSRDEVARRRDLCGGQQLVDRRVDPARTKGRHPALAGAPGRST